MAAKSIAGVFLSALFRSVVLATAIVCAASSRVVAQGTNKGEIRGRVVNAASKTPIVGATVDVTAPG